jgi:hypothetical protein
MAGAHAPFARRPKWRALCSEIGPSIFHAMKAPPFTWSVCPVI